MLDLIRFRRSIGGEIPPLPSYVSEVENDTRLSFLMDFRSFLKSDDSLVQTTGTSINKIKDARSGNTLTATNVGGGAILALNNYNRRVIQLYGNGYFTFGVGVAALDLNPNNEFHIFTRIASYDNTDGGTIISKGTTDNSVRNYMKVIKNSSVFMQVGDAQIFEGSTDYKTTSPVPSNFHLKATSSQLQYRLNNTVISQSPSSPTYVVYNDETRLFAQGNGQVTASFRYTGKIEKILIFEGVMTEADITKVNDYMNLGRVL